MNFDNNSRNEKENNSLEITQGMDDSSNDNKKSKEQNNNCCDLPNINVIKGLVAIFLGTLFILIAHKIIVHALLLVSGFGLIYYGLATLNINQINDAIKWTMTKSRDFFKKLMK